ncbi:uncharacterized protein Z520_04427 [Fonsecaea multimorphosa CBS 102226]|uniref:DUF726-domain-containing protein n=1 Tax=Fonsecaea multimorphosa CBS 102226 TaxID=1442371 RepID=A0A0D2IS13_9EURO|nr:uncharacterized protein Z520_04427 [Fonsecaea multimorphosa CBS 102226]KIX99791.1 hypothetical protein Z520_04427 [Fonsecaea multimorphosa CBS 102226]OAL26579.1 hypothetical protein AYO22_04190 [Fonsecaea multimorphosa]
MPSLSSLKNRVNAAIPQQRPGGVGRAQSGDQQRKAEDDQSLGTLLTREERADLTLLISQTIEEMRRSLVRGFDERPRPKPKGDATGEAEADRAAVEVSKLSLSEQQSKGVDEKSNETRLEGPQTQADDDEPQVEPEADTLLTTPTPESKALMSAALAFFDAWAESVILRVGEVVNSRDEAVQDKNHEQTRKLATEAAKQQYRPTEREQEVDDKLSKVFPSVQTPLADLSQGERSTIIKAILLLLLSLEAYRAHSRVLLVRLAVSFGVSVAEVSKMEKDTAYGLLTAAAKMDASESTQKAQQASSTARKWKIGVAGVAGAALIGITGGLAAPLLAAGVGTLMGGLGLGATAAAGYLGALAGSSVLVGGLFGAYGARMTSQAMEKYSKEIDDFAFLPINGKEDDPEETQKQRRRLRITVGVSGWLTEEEQVTLPWRVLGEAGEPFALRWELQALLNLGSALKDFVVSQAWSQIRRELIKRTIFAAVWSALMAPLAIRKAIKLVDSPFGIAKMRAVKAGEVLADALINRVQGERPVSLIGQSLGARVVYSCLLTLAKRGAFGLVDNVVLMGAPVPSDEAQWRAMRSVVAGRLVNVYSRQDYILAFLYRTSSAQISIAGLQDIEGVSGVESFDLSDRVSGHLKYMHMTGPILREIGWFDIDDDVLRREEMLVRQINEEEKAVEQQGDDPEKVSV